MKNAEEVQQPTYEEEEEEREEDTYSNLHALIHDSNIKDPSLSDNSRVERGITVNVLLKVEATGTLLGEYSATMRAVWDNMRCFEMDMETNPGIPLQNHDVRSYHGSFATRRYYQCGHRASIRVRCVGVKHRGDIKRRHNKSHKR